MYLKKDLLLNTNVYDRVFYWSVHLKKNVLYLKRCGYVFSILVVNKTYVINLLGLLLPSWIWFMYLYIYIYIYIYLYIYKIYIFARDANMLPQRHGISNSFLPSNPYHEGTLGVASLNTKAIYIYNDRQTMCPLGCYWCANGLMGSWCTVTHCWYQLTKDCSTN